MPDGSPKGLALITGASGFIGGRLQAHLRAEGTQVVSLKRAHSPKPKGEDWYQVNYKDLDSLAQAVEEVAPDYVFHVAGATKGVTKGDFYEANVMPTENLLTVLKDRPIRRFVHVSSLASYGPTPTPGPLDETRPREPVEYYGRSKLEAERKVEASSLPWTIIRPGGVYGPGDIDYFQIFKLAARGWSLFYGNRDRTMSVVYVDDLVEAIVRAATSEHTVRQGYFICDGNPISWGGFQSEIAKASGRKVKELNLPEFFVPLAAVAGECLSRVDGKARILNRQKAIMGKQKAWTCTHESAKRDFGYKPTVPLNEGVFRAFAWYKDQGWL